MGGKFHGFVHALGGASVERDASHAHVDAI
jgi:hypothetical protein